MNPQSESIIPKFNAAEEHWKYYSSKYKGVVSESFSGQIETTTTCKTCKYSSSAFSPFRFLRLLLQDVILCNVHSIPSPGLSVEATCYSRSRVQAFLIKPEGEREAIHLPSIIVSASTVSFLLFGFLMKHLRNWKLPNVFLKLLQTTKWKRYPLKVLTTCTTFQYTITSFSQYFSLSCFS